MVSTALFFATKQKALDADGGDDDGDDDDDDDDDGGGDSELNSDEDDEVGPDDESECVQPRAYDAPPHSIASRPQI